MKFREKELAIKLRKEGKTYSEILSHIPVAKSTLSEWLRDVGLAKAQKQRITKLRMDAQRRGADKKRSIRLEKVARIQAESQKQIGKISNRELLLLGAMLYWAEGSKQKDWNVSQSLQFTNSDPEMIRFYLTWLRRTLRIKDKDMTIALAIHENNRHRLQQVIKHWEEVTGIKSCFSDRVYFKRHSPKGYRKNLGENYFGTVRITIQRSTDLNRKVMAWVARICENCRLV